MRAKETFSSSMTETANPGAVGIGYDKTKVCRKVEDGPLVYCRDLAAPVITASSAPVSGSGKDAVFTVDPADLFTVLHLPGSDSAGRPVTFSTTSAPSFGALSLLDPASGTVNLTWPAGSTGSTTFDYEVEAGGETSSSAVRVIFAVPPSLLLK